VCWNNHTQSKHNGNDSDITNPGRLEHVQFSMSWSFPAWWWLASSMKWCSNHHQHHVCYQWQYVISIDHCTHHDSCCCVISTTGPFWWILAIDRIPYFTSTIIYYIYIWVDLKIKLLLNPLVNPHFPIQLTISWVKNASIHLDPTGEAATLSSWSPQKLPSGRITKRWENLM